MTSIRTIIGIDARSVERLATVGIRTTDQLIEHGSSAPERLHLADLSHLDVNNITAWVHQADLLRIEGVGPRTAKLLCDAGICTVPKLAYRHAQSLYDELLSEHGKSVKQQLPSVDELRQYIERAKTLPKFVRH